jgi:hypothetical protein
LSDGIVIGLPRRLFGIDPIVVKVPRTCIRSVRGVGGAIRSESRRPSLRHDREG